MTAGARPVDVAIVGGGILGAATAAFLAEAGLTVRLHERSAIAAGASGRNSGIVQQPYDRVLAALYRASLAEYRTLAAGGALAFPAEPAGLLYVGRDGLLASRVAAEWSATWPDVRPEVLDGAALTRLEPALAPDLVACRLGIGFPVAPAAATTAFAELARSHGAEIVVGGEVRPAVEAGRAIGIDIGGGVVHAGAVVVSAGPWTPALIDPSGGWRPIRPVWGVVASIAVPDAPRHGLEAIDIDIEPGTGGRAPEDMSPIDDLVDFSLVPGSGSSALGSTFLPDEPEPARWIDPLRRVGSRYVPAIAGGAVVGVRACARPVSLDGRPLVGRVPGVADLWIAAGHGPWGISTGPGTARLLADSLLGTVGDHATPEELRPDRFGAPTPR